MYQNYITGQTTLSLNLDFSIPANHIASVISEFVDSIPNEVILETTSNTGRPAYHPAMMLNILLFAYSRRVFSGRKIERMLEENLPMMILADNRKISYHTINNFRSSDHANKVIKQCFVYFTALLEDEELIRENAVFIDGTKIEADANRYTFVWRKAIEKYHAKLREDVSALYEELINKEVVKAMAEEEAQTSQGLEILAQETEKEVEKLTEKIDREPKAIPGGSKNKAKRRELKKIAFNTHEKFLANCANNGAISNMDPDSIVEVPALFGADGIQPMATGKAGRFQRGLMMEQQTCEKLVVDAYVEHSYNKMLQAFALNKTVPDASVAKKILDDMIPVNAPYWPELK